MLSSLGSCRTKGTYRKQIESSTAINLCQPSQQPSAVYIVQYTEQLSLTQYFPIPVAFGDLLVIWGIAVWHGWTRHCYFLFCFSFLYQIKVIHSALHCNILSVYLPRLQSQAFAKPKSILAPLLLMMFFSLLCKQDAHL